MNKFIKPLKSLAMVAFMASMVQAGDAAYRVILTPAGSTNVSYTVGRYEKPRLLTVETVGVNVGTNLLVVAYGDTAGGTRTLCTITNLATTAGSNVVYNFSNPFPELMANDVVTFGHSSTTNGSVRLTLINRDSKPNN